MPSIIERFGSIVEAQVPTHPARSRRLLAAAYEGVAARGRFMKPTAYASLIERFNGRIAHRIATALRHPERTAIVNVFMPCELLETFGLLPAFPEGIAVYVACTSCSSVFATEAENHGIPESFCSYHKVMLGMAEAGVLRRPRLIAATTLACDANQLSFRRLAELTGAPEVLIDVPPVVDEDAVDYVYDQLLTLAAMLEDLCGRTFDAEDLRRRLSVSAETLSKLRAYGQMRGSVVLPTTMTGELCSFIAAHCMLGTDAAADYATHLLALARRAPKLDVSLRERAPRIFWMHTLPNWQMSQRALFDNPERAELLGCDLADDYRGVLDDPNPLHQLARRVVENINNGPGERRIAAALEQALSRHADGVVIFGHSGCKHTLGLSALAQARFEAAGLSTLVLDGDGCDGRNVSEEAMLTRAGAFLETLRERIRQS